VQVPGRKFDYRMPPLLHDVPETVRHPRDRGFAVAAGATPAIPSIIFNTKRIG
jgi:hypothetical protein